MTGRESNPRIGPNTEDATFGDPITYAEAHFGPTTLMHHKNGWPGDKPEYVVSTTFLSDDGAVFRQVDEISEDVANTILEEYNSGTWDYVE